MIRLLLKIVFAPVIAVLALVVWICMGLPMAAAWLLSKVQDFRYFIQDWIYG